MFDDTTPRKPARREPLGATLLDVIARAESDPGCDAADLIEQLRAVVAAVETPSDRLLARYRRWPAGPGYLYARR